jgi:serpin B
MHVKRLGSATGRASGTLTRALRRSAARSGARLDAANALWGANDASFRRRYLDVLRRDFGAPLERVDFRGDPDGARTRINKWVADHTNDRIHDLFTASDINARTRLAMANALYFKADWLAPFDPDQTQPETFHAPGGNVTAQMMDGTSRFEFAHTRGLDAVDLPYKGRRFSMLVLMPAAGGMGALERGLTAQRVTRIAGSLELTDLRLRMPRFRVEARLPLAGPLKAMGMSRAFSDAAEFPRISRTESLKIQSVVHKVWIEVGEKGTEAAAATGISFEPTSASVPPPRALTIDRPFLFVLRDNATGAALFLGRVEDPAS